MVYDYIEEQGMSCQLNIQRKKSDTIHTHYKTGN